jgi:hypothetical protein
MTQCGLVLFMRLSPIARQSRLSTRLLYGIVAGMKMLGIRYAVASVACFGMWCLLSISRPCRTSFVQPPPCSIWERIQAIGSWDVFDWLVLAFAAFVVAILWTAAVMTLRLWRAVEIATRRKRLGSWLGFLILCGVAMVWCVVIDQLRHGVHPCFGDFIQRPGYIFGCYIFKEAAELPDWLTNDVSHYVPLVILAFVVAIGRLAYLDWKRAAD